MIAYIVQRFCEWEHLGTKMGDDGSRIIAHTPRDYPEAYLHRFFAAVPEQRWHSYGLRLPKQLQRFYRECNGLSIFAGSIEIYGIRAHYARDDSAQFQPFDLATHHAECMHNFRRDSKGKEEQGIYFGGYGDDGSRIFTSFSDPQIHRVLRQSGKVANSWPDLTTFLKSEYDRLDHLFGRDGYLINGEATTTPESTVGVFLEPE